MKSKLSFIYLGISFFAVCSCANTHSSVDRFYGFQEALIAIQCKMMKHGTISILSGKDSNVRLTVYHYSISLSERTAYCSIMYDVTNPEPELVNSYTWRTDNDLKKREKGTWRETYFRCFSEDFLDLSNEEKKELLDSLSDVQ